jgi:anti-sigma B factor antagonist
MTDLSSPAEAPLALGPEMTVAHAAELRERLLETIADGRATLALDLSAVTDFDSAGVQLLLAARRTMTERGGQLHLGAVPAPVRDALRLFSLDAQFAAPAAA